MSVSYATRRTMSASSSATWARNRNAVRHAPRVTLGPISHTITVGIIVLLIGFIYVLQSSRVTDYDVAVAEIDSEIADLEAQRDALVVETAKITASASDSDKNTVAAAMIDAQSVDFVQE